MKRLFVLFLAVMLLCGCAGNQEPPTEPSQTETIPQTKPQETTQPTQETTQPTPPPTEPAPQYFNPLTGEGMDQQVYARPYAVVLNNSKAAMPQHGVGAADILYEALIEGETRCLGIFYNMNPETAKTLGTIRSARYYFIQIAQSYDAIYVHNGQSSDEEIGAKQYFKKTGWEHMDAITSPGANKFYYRDRKELGYSYEHTLFIRPDGVVSLAEQLKFNTLRELPLDVGLTFNDDKLIIGDSAENVRVWFNFSGKPSPRWHKSTLLTYNKEEKVYYASQHHPDCVNNVIQDQPYVDGNTEETVKFRNVLILRTAVSQKKESELLYIQTTGSGTGIFLCNGQAVEINWSRENVEDPFVYTLAATGEEVTFGVGHTYVAVVPNKATVEIG